MQSEPERSGIRNFAGYGKHLPGIRWPGNAKLAVSFVVNFEEGAEFSISDGDPRNEAVYEVTDRQEIPDYCIDSHFEYATRSAWWRVASLFDKYGVRFTLSACGRAVERSPWLALDAAARGHEVAGHGWRWESHAGMSRAAERGNITRTVDAIRAATGTAPRGWHTRSLRTGNTRHILVQQGFLYDSDAYNDDTPYFVNIDGKRHLVLPYAFDTNDMQFQITNRFVTAANFSDYVCDAYDWLAREGEAMPRMLSVGLHLRMIGRPGRMKALETMLQHMVDSKAAWFATREQIARHWIAETGPAPD